MAAGYGIAGHTNTYTRASVGNWTEDKLADEATRRRGFEFTPFEATTEARARFSHPGREPARDLGPRPLPSTDADPRAGQPPHILMAHGRRSFDPKADDPTRFASMSHTMHSSAVAAMPLSSTDALAEPDRRRAGVEAALIGGNRTGLMTMREKTLMVGADPRDPRGAGGGGGRPAPAGAGATAFSTTSRLATKPTEDALRISTALRGGDASASAAAASSPGVETITIPDGLGGTVTRVVGKPSTRKPGFTASFATNRTMRG
ncbi:hypothetical protein FNF27_00714 [Cafeteria roenbergensis]|uniref:Uncharacterized protein n=1 Tax=Cafeteria roenbergensis TaxID=33653 RepID=A0A5A8C2M1_CAFRO|nr:hypothetical protein FNF29_07550 [Cafeteria roenbergensis]KAA0177544.1 hypothetical protein FNF27_00714 [Cafeteria roenbergensis]|eukprot:KAA0147178.1 hypothetical protein FNF29_07550 [Cafeteria roenbergensis]